MRGWNRILTLILWFLVVQISGCNYTHFKNPDFNFRNTLPLSKTEQAALGYAQVFQQVLDPYCVSCHRSGLYPLMTYTQTSAVLAKIRRSVFETGTMPKGRILPAKERSLLLAWLDSGAPEFGKSPEPSLPPLEPTFSSIRDRIFNVRCGDCHQPTSKYCQDFESPTNKASCHIELSSYQELLNGEEESRKELVVPGFPDESQLVIAIERTDGKDQMPPPEEGYSPLSPEEIKVIKDWIAAGAPEN